MRYKLKGLSLIISVAISALFLVLSQFFSLNEVVGVQLSSFTLFSAIMPLAGTVGFGFSGLIYVVRSLFKYMIVGSPLALVYNIPSLCASASWITRNKLVTIGIPALCMVLFWAHPVGYAASPFALYWFIPISIALNNRSSLFLASLQSTFIAHAVGSVIWLYIGNIPATVWLGLIPIVAVERLIFASLMTLVYSVAVSVADSYIAPLLTRVRLRYF